MSNASEWHAYIVALDVSEHIVFEDNHLKTSDDGSTR
jgi:hypothetical protein